MKLAFGIIAIIMQALNVGAFAQDAETVLHY